MINFQDAIKQGIDNVFALGYFNEIKTLFLIPFVLAVLALFFKDGIRYVINILRSK